MECSICLDRAGDNVVLACDHAYCEQCIERWCTGYRAQCPMCRRPVHGLATSAERVVYLSPHAGAAWGVKLARQTCVTERGVFRLLEVSPETETLRANQLVRVFGTRGKPITTIGAVERFAAEAHSKKRLLKVQTLGESSEPARQRAPLRCFVFLRRIFEARSAR